MAKSLLLWLRHVLEAEHQSRDMPRYFLRHEDFRTDWRRHLNHAADETGVIWPAPCSQSDIEIEKFLNEALHHERASIEELRNHPDITPLIRIAYQILRSMAVDGESRELRAQMDLVRTIFNESCDVLAIATAEAEHLRGELRARILDHEAVVRTHHAIVRAHHELSLECDAMVRDRDAFLAERNALLASRSWRWTAPLRWVRGPFVHRT
ncbi:hypothetical protein [Mesorhizobium sp. Cs1321R2N1]|uniref:hypothetical protein n=1 Tax=Mesorhizobium sp. Cs1321R2N1 TaxID=3015174 RepID=UPI00301CB839